MNLSTQNLADAEMLSELWTDSRAEFLYVHTPLFPTTRRQHLLTRLITKRSCGGAVAVCACASVKYGGPRHCGMPGRQWRRPSQFLLRSDIAFNKFSAILHEAHDGNAPVAFQTGEKTVKMLGYKIQEELGCADRWN